MDADEKVKDAIPVKGQDSEAKAQKDSTPPKKFYSEDEVEAKFSQQRSVLDKKVVGLEKQVKSYEGKDVQITELRGRLDKIVKERDESDLVTHRDDPDAIKSIHARQELRTKEAELSKGEQELSDSKKAHQDALDELVTSKKERNALEIALKHSVPFEKLLKFTDGSTEQMEELAQSLPKKEEITLNPDSNTGPGGGELSEEDKLKVRYPTMK